MNLNTLRLTQFEKTKRTEKQKRSKTQECYVLAFLKYKNIGKYQDLSLKDKPDLQGSNWGIEVTTAEFEKVMHTNGEFEKFVKEPNYKSYKTVYDNGSEITNCLFGYSLCAGGGWNGSYYKDLLRDAIEKKLKIASQYRGDYAMFDLALIKPELEVTEFKNSLAEWMKQILSELENTLFNNFYIFYRNSCFIFDANGIMKKEVIVTESENRKLQLLAQKTVEEEVSFDDPEWN